MEELFDFLLEGMSPKNVFIFDKHLSLTFAFFLQPLLQYLIFPAQFAFLYSYYPSGKMGKLPSDLEAKWKTKHFEDAESAFAEVAKNGQKSAGPSFFQKAEVTEKETVTP